MANQPIEYIDRSHFNLKSRAAAEAAAAFSNGSAGKMKRSSLCGKKE